MSMSIHRILALATFAIAGAACAPAFAHAKLQASDPQAGSTLDSAPKQVHLKFNEALEPAFSKIKLTGPQNNEIPLTATVDQADPAVMTAPLPALSSGDYRIQWSTMTHDGHKVKGEVAFKVK
jgi:methionine-rich copper-binding protein CopC